MSRKELQKDKGSKNGVKKGAETKAKYKKSKSEGQETQTGVNRLGTLVDITKFLPVGYPNAAADVVPINFGNTLSSHVDIVTSTVNTSSGAITDEKKMIITPGICAIDLTSTIGPQSPSDCDTLYNAINECANSMYAHIRMSNAGGKNYDPSDLVLYIYAVASAYAFHGYLKRLYGIAKYYNYFNTYTPVKLLEACGWGKPGAIFTSMSNFRDIINTFGRRLAVFPIPTTIPIVERMAHLFDDVYLDSDSERAQMYLFRPHGLYVYDETQANTLKLDYNITDFSNTTTAGIANKIDAIIDPILKSQSLGEIKRDILSTYPASTWYVPEEVSPDYMVIPKLDYNVLLAIHNCTVVEDVLGDIKVNSEGKIYQEVTHGASLTNNIPKQRLIDLKGIPSGSVNAGAVLMGTMFTSMRDTENFAYSPEVVTNLTIYGDWDGTKWINEQVKQTYYYSGIDFGDSDLSGFMASLPFEYFPIVEMRNRTHAKSYLNTGFDAYRILECEDMMRINRMKMEGLFGLPYHIG